MNSNTAAGAVRSPCWAYTRKPSTMMIKAVATVYFPVPHSGPGFEENAGRAMAVMCARTLLALRERREVCSPLSRPGAKGPGRLLGRKV